MTDKKPKPPFYLMDTSHAFYQPLVTRIIIVAIAFFWMIIELTHGDGFWMVLSGAMAAYTMVALFIRFEPTPQTPVEKPAENEGDNEVAAPEVPEAPKDQP